MSKVNKKKQTKSKVYRVPENNELLTFLLTIPGYSRNNIKSLLSRKQVLVNDVPVSQFNFNVYKGDEIKITPYMNKRMTATKGSKLKVIYEDNIGEFTTIYIPFDDESVWKRFEGEINIRN